MNRRIIPILAFLVALVLVLCSVTALLTYTARIGGTAQMKAVGIGVYSDAVKMTPLTSTDWGMFEPGQSKSGSCYIGNNGNVPLTLTMQTENWQPTAAANYITLTWNYDGSQLAAGNVKQVTFTLAVNANITGIQNFSFTTVIVGTG